MIAVVTDSTSQLDPGLAGSLGVRVVPVEVTIGERSYAEGVDITPDEFYRLIDADPDLPITTSQPSPGTFVETYRKAIADGAEAIVSVHVGGDVSGTLNSARIAAREVDVPVELVDSGTVSFGVACQAWAAADAAARGATPGAVAATATATAARVRTTFMLDARGIAGVSARTALPDHIDGCETVVLAGIGRDIDVVGSGSHLAALVDSMVGYVEECATTEIDVAVCLAHPDTLPITERLESRLGAFGAVRNLVRYRIGPSVAAYTGVGTAGCFFWPVTDTLMVGDRGQSGAISTVHSSR